MLIQTQMYMIICLLGLFRDILINLNSYCVEQLISFSYLGVVLLIYICRIHYYCAILVT
jgi:hypothetical protein